MDINRLNNINGLKVFDVFHLCHISGTNVWTMIDYVRAPKHWEVMALLTRIQTIMQQDLLGREDRIGPLGQRWG